MHLTAPLKLNLYNNLIKSSFILPIRSKLCVVKGIFFHSDRASCFPLFLSLCYTKNLLTMILSNSQRVNKHISQYAEWFLSSKYFLSHYLFCLLQHCYKSQCHNLSKTSCSFSHISKWGYLQSQHIFRRRLSRIYLIFIVIISEPCETGPNPVNKTQFLDKQ